MEKGLKYSSFYLSPVEFFSINNHFKKSTSSTLASISSSTTLKKDKGIDVKNKCTHLNILSLLLKQKSHSNSGYFNFYNTTLENAIRSIKYKMKIH